MRNGTDEGAKAMTTTLREGASRAKEGEAASRAARFYELLGEHPPEVLALGPELRQGVLTDRYFLRAAGTLAREGRDPVTTLQVFAKKQGKLAGVAEAIRTLQSGVAAGCAARDLEVRCLVDGDEIEPWEPVFHITGPYRALAHLETPILGGLARRTMVCTNVAAAARAAGEKPIFFMAARHDDWRLQAGDGYAARVGGAAGVSSDGGGAWWGGEGMGTMPHALIAAYDGDAVAATLALARYLREMEPAVPVVSLVDYENDVIGTSLAVARAMRGEYGAGSLFAVRVDTSEGQIDRALRSDSDGAGAEAEKGVNPRLVDKLRRALDDAGFPEVRIFASGGFSPAKIRAFEAARAPVDAYGVGSALLGHKPSDPEICAGFDFTADVVRVGGAPQAKAGREYIHNPRHVTVDWSRVV